MLPRVGETPSSSLTAFRTLTAFHNTGGVALSGRHSLALRGHASGTVRCALFGGIQSIVRHMPTLREGMAPTPDRRSPTIESTQAAPGSAKRQEAVSDACCAFGTPVQEPVVPTW